MLMKRVYSHPDMSVVHLVKNELENLGIEAVIRNDLSAGLLGAYVGSDNWNELWIVDDEQLPQAVRAIQVAIGPTASSEEATWTCQQCGEEIEAQFAACWNCGQERQES